MRFEVYCDRAGGWRWRLRARNGRLVADGAEAYTRRADARRAAHRVRAELRYGEPPTVRLSAA